MMLNEDIQTYILKPLNIRQEHLALDEDCLEIGGNSTQFKGLLAWYLKDAELIYEIVICERAVSYFRNDHILCVTPQRITPPTSIKLTALLFIFFVRHGGCWL